MFGSSGLEQVLIGSLWLALEPCRLAGRRCSMRRNRPLTVGIPPIELRTAPEKSVWGDDVTLEQSAHCGRGKSSGLRPSEAGVNRPPSPADLAPSRFRCTSHWAGARRSSTFCTCQGRSAEVDERWPCRRPSRSLAQGQRMGCWVTSSIGCRVGSMRRPSGSLCCSSRSSLCRSCRSSRLGETPRAETLNSHPTDPAHRPAGWSP